eukprot:COSAG06_NODE_15048_length_1101_cov_1.238523_1_plen_72_part_10
MNFPCMPRAKQGEKIARIQKDAPRALPIMAKVYTPVYIRDPAGMPAATHRAVRNATNLLTATPDEAAIIIAA